MDWLLLYFLYRNNKTNNEILENQRESQRHTDRIINNQVRQNTQQYINSLPNEQRVTINRYNRQRNEYQQKNKQQLMLIIILVLFIGWAIIMFHLINAGIFIKFKHP